MTLFSHAVLEKTAENEKVTEVHRLVKASSKASTSLVCMCICRAFKDGR